MATARAHVRIARSADEVWKALADPDAIQQWFPAITDSTTTNGRRHIVMGDGTEIDEEIVTVDDSLRRFQYRLLPGAVPLEQHLATVDVIDDGDGALVVYGVDVQPDAMGAPMQQAAEGLAGALKAHLEG